jgi:hypothetical protein
MKIPKQLYVTGREYGNYIQGFLHPHEPTSKTDAKKKKTQMEWAYGFYGQAGAYETNDGLVYLSRRNVLFGMYTEGYTLTLADYQPQVWENEPLEGFKIRQSVSRSSTSNKLWQIDDPRGVVFEITTGCMETLLEQGTVSKNEILGKCIWLGNKNLAYA